MELMDVSSIATTVSSYNIGSSTEQVSDQQAIGVAMLGKVMESNQDMSMGLIQAMEKSINPHLGGNIDVYL